VSEEKIASTKPYKPPFTITSKILDLTAKITEKMSELKHSSHQTITPLLRKKNRIKTLAGTLEIEGNFLGEEKITALLEGKRVLGTIPEIAEVEGAIRAYQELENYRYDDMNDLLHAHKLLMGEILRTAGSFRSSNVRVGEHIAPQAHLVPELMIQLFEWVKKSDEHMLLKSCIFHYEFEFIHPFSDGNGRMGRLWQSVMLHNYNPLFSSLPTEGIVRDHQEEYYKALEDATALGESTPFIEFMLEIILQTIQNTLKTDQVSDYVSDQVEKLLQVMDEQWLSSSEIMKKLELSHKPTFRKNYLNPALEHGLVEMREPESPRSPKQKYRVSK